METEEILNSTVIAVEQDDDGDLYSISLALTDGRIVIIAPNYTCDEMGYVNVEIWLEIEE